MAGPKGPATRRKSFMNQRHSNHLAIILVEPQTPGNIGSVARAMANFGVGDLRLVAPCDHLAPEARKFAVGAAPLLEGAQVYEDLPSALADLTTTVAATRRRGQLRGALKNVGEMPHLLAELPAEGRLGLVFGREDAGLTSAEVALCAHGARIETAPELGSLNLAQAVLLFLYECTRKSAAQPATPHGNRPVQGEMEALFRQMETVLERIAFLNPRRPEGAMNALRRIFRRADLDQRELSLLRGMWSQIAWSIRDWRGRKRGED